MGKEIIFNQIPLDKRNLITEIIGNYCALDKQEDDNGWLLTKISPKSNASNNEWLSILSANKALSENNARRLIILVDFMAAAMPDCIDQLWQKNIADVASFLRKRFYRTFGKSAYA